MEDIRHRTTGPYLPFKPRPLASVFIQSVSVVASGGFTFGGFASTGFIGSQTQVGRPVRPVGPSFPFSSRPLGYTQGARSYSLSATGGITFGGAASANVTIRAPNIGWICQQMGPAFDFKPTPFGQTPPAGSPVSYAYTPSGGITFSGASTATRGWTYAPSGGLQFGGAASIAGFNPPPIVGCEVIDVTLNASSMTIDVESSPTRITVEIIST